MSLIIDGTSGVTFNDSSLQGAAASPYVLKNRIINGDMRIDQRNAGASVTPTGDTYTVDRWKYEISQASKFAIQQNAGSVTQPAGFTNYLGFTSTSAYTVGSGDYFLCEQFIEGFNTADLAWGTASARTITLSFWVRSSLTGTFGGNLQNGANARFYPFSYTISSANTWEQKTITISGDTTGTWSTNNTTGILLRFNLGMGSTFLGTAGSWGSTALLGVTGQTNVVGTNGATWYVTGVQLEQNTSATPFERRLYGQEFINCQRYYQTYTQPSLRGVVASATGANRMAMGLPVVMRTAPTAVVGNMGIFDGTSVTNITSVGVAYLSTTQAEFDLNVGGGLTTGRACVVYQAGPLSMTLSAEL
jgi:hypothetical protein